MSASGPSGPGSKDAEPFEAKSSEPAASAASSSKPEEDTGSVEHLLLLFAETGRIVPALNTIYDRGWQKTKAYDAILSRQLKVKEEEIKQLCNDNYTDFIEAIDQLIGVEKSVGGLRSDVNTLNDRVQSSGRSLEDEMTRLIKLKKTRRRMGATMRQLKRILAALDLYKSVVELVSTKRYVNALKALNTLYTQHLVPLHEFTIAREILETVDSLKTRIRSNVDAHFFAWVDQMDKKSRELGRIAMSQHRTQLKAYDSYDPTEGGAAAAASYGGGQQKLLETEMQQSIQLQFSTSIPYSPASSSSPPMRSSAAVSSTNPFELAELAEATEMKSEIVKGPSEVGSSLMGATTAQRSVFEMIESENFLAVYECINVHQLLSDLKKLSEDYRKARKQMLEKLCRTAPVSDVSRYLSDICGFFVLEHAICTRYSQLIELDELQKYWTEAMPLVRARLRKEVIKVGTSDTPIEKLFEIKDECIILTRVLENYDFKVSLIYAFLEQLRIEFERRLLLDLRAKVKNEIVLDIGKKLKALDIGNDEDYRNCVIMFGLDVSHETFEADEKKTHDALQSKFGSRDSKKVRRSAGAASALVPPSTGRLPLLPDLDEKSEVPSVSSALITSATATAYGGGTAALFGVGSMPLFPMTLPFSLFVSGICMHLLDFIESYQQFAKHAHDMNSRIRSAFEKGIVDAVCRAMTDMIVLGDLDLNALSQVAVNCRYLQLALQFFENELSMDESVSQFLGESVRVPKLRTAREAFEGVHSQTIDKLIELLTEELNIMLAATWPGAGSMVTDRTQGEARQWVVKVMEYLTDVLQRQMRHLEFQYRETGYYVAYACIKMFLKSVLFGSGEEDDLCMRHWNAVGMYNLHLDVDALEKFAARSGVGALKLQLREVRVLLDLLLSGPGLLDYMDEDSRDTKYAYIQPHQLRSVLEKFKPLGFMKRLPKGSKVPKITKDVVKNVLKTLR